MVQRIHAREGKLLQLARNHVVDAPLALTSSV